MKTFLILFILAALHSSCKEKPENTNAVIFKFDLYDGLAVESTSVIQNKLEANINRIMSDLNVENSGTFTVHIWKNTENYLAAQEQLIGMRYPGSTGYVMGMNDLALLYVTGVEENAEHELAHCISLHVKGSFANNPRWLWEAVAIYESSEFNDPQNISYMKSGNYPTINELNNDFNNGSRKIYEVGYLITEFILNEWQKDKLIDLIKNFGNIQNVLNISVTEFEAKWKKFVMSKYFGLTG